MDEVYPRVCVAVPDPRFQKTEIAQNLNAKTD